MAVNILVLSKQGISCPAVLRNILHYGVSYIMEGVVKSDVIQ